MNKIEYKFVKLPYVSIKGSLFNKGKDTNDLRIPKLEKEFNELGQEGWTIVEIYWLEGLALFKRENKNKS